MIHMRGLAGDVRRFRQLKLSTERFKLHQVLGAIISSLTIPAVMQLTRRFDQRYISHP